jgi:hypothetical protein
MNGKMGKKEYKERKKKGKNKHNECEHEKDSSLLRLSEFCVAQ